jgi:hypothetical protein
MDRVLVRVRGALDLPSRAEMIDLTERLEQLDRRISELAAERVAELSRAAPALPAPAAEPEIETIAADRETPSTPTEAATERASGSDQSAPERVRRSSARRSSARTGKR